MTTATKKKGGLAAFSGKRAEAATPTLNHERIRRGSGETVSLTVRVSKDNWMRLRQFAMSEGETLQTMAMHGFNLALAEKGQPPLEG